MSFLPKPFASFVTAANSNISSKFGAILPLTGPAQTYGQRIQDGIEMARTDLMREQIEVKVYYEDVSKPGAIAVTAARNLFENQKIQSLVGNFWNPVIPIIAPVIKQAGVISFHTSEADDYTTSSGEFVFSTNATISDEAGQMAEFAYNSLKARTAAIMYVGTSFGEQ